jgi:hypothetical protein
MGLLLYMNGLCRNTSDFLNQCSLFDINFNNTEQGISNDDLRS